MGFQDIIHVFSGRGYRKLQNQTENAADLRGQWERKVKGKAVSLQPSSTKRRQSRCSSVVLRKMVAETYSEIMSRTMLEGIVCPTIIFSSQWGLPALSHPSIVRRKGGKFI